MGPYDSPTFLARKDKLLMGLTLQQFGIVFGGGFVWLMMALAIDQPLTTSLLIFGPAHALTVLFFLVRPAGVGDLPYDPADDCEAIGTCSEHMPWEHPLPWGSGQSDYELRPLWGDYNPEVSPPEATAPYPERHPGFDFICPHCPRLDWCHVEPGTARTNKIDRPSLTESPRDYPHDRPIVDDSLYGPFTSGPGGTYNVAPPTQPGSDPCEVASDNCGMRQLPQPAPDQQRHAGQHPVPRSQRPFLLQHLQRLDGPD